MLKKQIEDSMKNLEKSMESLYASPALFANYIKNCLNFSQYSPLNQAYILAQCPEAKFVATYNQWKKLGFQVKEKGALHILAPVLLKGLIDEKGKWVALSKATESQKKNLASGLLSSKNILYKYRECPVFDISKTNATEEDLVKLLSEKQRKSEFGQLTEESVYRALTNCFPYISNKNTLAERNYEIVRKIIEENARRDESVLPSEKEFFIDISTYVALDRMKLKNVRFEWESRKRLSNKGQELVKMHQRLCEFAEEQVIQLVQAFQ